MYKRALFFLFVVLTAPLFSQIITTEPAIPVASEAVTVFYDATLGTAGLQDYTGDVYAHTGVLTENSSGSTDWKYLKTDWGENTTETKLTRVSENLYSLQINPSIREYYGVPDSETITHMAFVFRSADNSKEGKGDGATDIFVEVFAEGLNVSISTPGNNTLTSPGTSVAFAAAASETATLKLYQNNNLVNTAESTTIAEIFSFNISGDYWLKVTAQTIDEFDADSVFVHVLEEQVNEMRPEGALNGINYTDDQTVTLVLHAPGKEHVFAIGDFNRWTPGTDGRMKKDDGHWWITLENLEPGIEYAYQYLVDGTLYIADPYTEKILDPVNDKWISEETYPGLKDYPSAYTSGITSILQTAQPEYQWKHADYTTPPKENLVIYELLVRDFIAAHDWKTLTDTLNYLDNLGINAIELMPFNEFEGNESWGYNPSFYFSPDKYYGPAQDLKVFIDSCHARDIAVIMDMTLNHSFSQSPLVQLYFNESTKKVTPDNPWYNVDSPNDVYAWGYDFNHESAATKEFVYRVNNHWLNEYDIDGFRFDFTKGFTNTPGDGWAYDAARISILKKMAGKVWETNPDAYVIFEHLSDNSEEKVLADYGIMLWGNLNYNYNEATMGYHEDGKSDFSWISYKKRGWNDPNLVGYMESHDEERLMFKNLMYGNHAGYYYVEGLNTALARMELAGTFFFTIPGPKMIWQFGELGYDYSIDYNGRVGNKPIRWDYFDFGTRHKLYQVWSALIELKKTEPAFSTDDFDLNLAYPAKRIELNHPEMDVRIMGNFDVVEQAMDPNFSKTGTWYSYFEGSTIEVNDVNEMISLAPGEYRMYTTRQLAVPLINSKDEYEISGTFPISVYPVPASDVVFVESDKILREISLYDTNGRLIKNQLVQHNRFCLNLSDHAKGMYLIRILYNDGSGAYSKLIIE
ncbi:MAG: T9SS type A sorting domain-containing protein [Bacteroidales bacterium]|nr:T9SS type A sorting domain-containing protein [Bacteroidales bacterium]